MEQVLTGWLVDHGVSAAVAACIIVVLAQLTPVLLNAIKIWASQLQNVMAHDALLALVRAAEQLFATNDEKLSYVTANAEEQQLGVSIAEIEAAVHEVKAPLKALAQAAVTKL